MPKKRFIPNISTRNESKNWFSFLKNVHKVGTFQKLFLSMAVVGLYTFVFDYILMEVLRIPNITPTMHQILGITLGLLLVIRTNTAYDRWWEGRRVVGNLTNSTRNFALELNAFLPQDSKQIRNRFASLICSYPFAVKEHLREGVKFEELEDLDSVTLDELKKAYHVPNKIAQILFNELQAVHASGDINGFQLVTLARRLEDFTDVVGACERIKKTPLPQAYSYHLKFFILVYISTLPIGLLHEIHYWTIPATMIVFYAMVGLEMIGEEIEDPFGTDENDIPMDNISANIRHNIYEIMMPEVTSSKDTSEVVMDDPITL